MNWKIISALILISSFVNAATISGTTFEWYTLEPLENVIIEINTTPNQLMVAELGFYSFNVPQGNYELNAFYFDGNNLKYRANEKIIIEADGNFTRDILMLPPLEENDFLMEDIGEITIPETPAVEEPKEDLGQIGIGIVLLIVAMILIIYGAEKITKSATGLKTERIGIEEKYFERSKEFLETKENQTSQKTDKDLDEVLGILKRYGGRMTQKDLRNKVDFGEAKTSLIIAELEEMGKIKKFKKGRGNIIVLK
ncbi:MAG: hypothetical protein NUV57_01155 [archaeon]|nr:hypothetical protein [archaeon]